MTMHFQFLNIVQWKQAHVGADDGQEKNGEDNYGQWNKGCYFGEEWEDVDPGVKFYIQNFRTRGILA